MFVIPPHIMSKRVLQIRRGEMREFKTVCDPILTVITQRRRPLGYLGSAERIT
jgi:hypothetical protein